jgi:hypothetical protein
MLKGKKGKGIPVTGGGGPQGCDTSRLPHFLDNQLTDGGEVVITDLFWKSFIWLRHCERFFLNI